MATILCVDDDAAARLVLRAPLAKAGHAVVEAHDVPTALHAIAAGGVDLVISDYQMPAITGLEFLELLRREGFDVPLIMLTGFGSIEHAVAAIKAGAIDYITKPVRPPQLLLAVDQALDLARLRRENRALKEELQQLKGRHAVVGESEAFRRVMRTAATAAPTRATVLLQGESGTGKEVVARAIHDGSDRRERPFIQVNCAALPEGLIESALFGHEKGAFTGAIKRVEGAFERADRGTLLLDEISEMRVDLQAKLLRALQEQEFERVGGSHPIRVDVRVIATTNRDLATEVEAGRFRQDLYYRLSVIPIQLPPLRERPEDIPLLAMRFAHAAAAEYGKSVEGIAPDALRWLTTRPWPGNVRELQHAVERAVILTDHPLVPLVAFEPRRHGLTPSLGVPAVTTDAGPNAPVVLASLDLAVAEQTLIAKAIERAAGVRTVAARMLGISDRTLRHKLNGK
jgi:DNA-binding NtrC family response regulator